MRLLDDVPSLVRQVPLLSRRDVDVAALRVGQGVELRGLGRVVVNLDVVQGDAGQRLDAGLEVVWQAGLVLTGLAIRFRFRTLDRCKLALQQFLFLRPRPLHRRQFALQQFLLLRPRALDRLSAECGYTLCLRHDPRAVLDELRKLPLRNGLGAPVLNSLASDFRQGVPAVQVPRPDARAPRRAVEWAASA